MLKVFSPSAYLGIVFVLSSLSIFDSNLAGSLLLASLVLSISPSSLVRSRTVCLFAVALALALVATLVWSPYFHNRISYTDFYAFLILIYFIPLFKFLSARYGGVVYSLKVLDSLTWIMSAFSMLLFFLPDLVSNYNKSALYSCSLLAMCLLRFLCSSNLNLFAFLPPITASLPGWLSGSDSFSLGFVAFIFSLFIVFFSRLLAGKINLAPFSSRAVSSLPILSTLYNYIFVFLVLVVSVMALPSLFKLVALADQSGLSRDLSAQQLSAPLDITSSVRFGLQLSTLEHIYKSFLLPFGFVLTSHNVKVGELYESHSSYVELLKTYGILLVLAPISLRSLFVHSRQWYFSFLACTLPLLLFGFAHVIYRQPIALVVLFYIYSFISSFEVDPPSAKHGIQPSPYLFPSPDKLSR